MERLAFFNFGEVVSVFKGRHEFNSKIRNGKKQIIIFPVGGDPMILPRKISLHGSSIQQEKVVLCYPAGALPKNLSWKPLLLRRRLTGRVFRWVGLAGILIQVQVQNQVLILTLSWNLFLGPNSFGEAVQLVISGKLICDLEGSG